MRLREYPYVVVRFACRHCPRLGRYRVAMLAERLISRFDHKPEIKAEIAQALLEIDDERAA